MNEILEALGPMLRTAAGAFIGVIAAHLLIAAVGRWRLRRQAARFEALLYRRGYEVERRTGEEL